MTAGGLFTPPCTNLFYGWAEKNSRPQISSNERKRTKVNGLLSVDAVSGEEYLRLKQRAKTEDISSYFASLCFDCVRMGITRLSVILDNNSTHRKKMQAQLQIYLSELGIKDKIKVEFIYTAPYSPDLNLAEYIIHLLRLRLLHHQPVGITIQQIGEKLPNFLQSSQLQTPEQIQNILKHIYSLGG